MKRIHYYIDKNVNNEKIYIDYNALKGINFAPKNNIKYAGIVVSKIVVVKPSFIQKVLKRKIKKKLELYLKLIIKFIESEDGDNGDALREALNDITRYKSIISHKYRKYLDQKYLNLLIKKIAILEYELNSKLINYNELEYEEELTVHRRR